MEARGADSLLERGDELGAIEARLAGVADSGTVVVVRGVAGLGKSVLAQAAAARARDGGARVVRATASQLDRRYPFGVVHQLLDAEMADPGRRARLLAGAAGRAEAVLTGDEDSGGEEYVLLHALYWALVNLAEEQPLVLLVDDLHWADSPSLRVLEYLGRRLDGVPIAVVATTRPAEPDADQAVVDALAAGPAALTVDLQPLSEPASAALIEAVLGRAPDPAFTRACVRATRGNPLLLRTLLREVVAADMRGDAADAGEATSLAAAGLSASTARRLQALGAAPTAVGEALAVIGDLRPAGSDVALRTATGLDPAALTAALHALAAAGLVEREPAEFSHPLIREAVLAGVGRARRSALHATAAAALADAGALPGDVARHLLRTDPAADAVVVASLRAAADAARAAPAEAAGYLRRALEEPPEAAERPALLLALGEAQARAADPAAAATLDAAVAEARDPDERAAAVGARGTYLVHSDPAAALDELERAAADAVDPDLRLRLEALALELSCFHVAFIPKRAELLAAGASDPASSAAMLTHLAIEANWRGAPATESRRLTEAALADGRLLADVGAGSSTFNLLVHTLRYVERPDETARLLRDGAAASQRRGSDLAAFFIDHAWAYWHLAFGSVASGLGHAESGLRQVTELGFDVTVPAFHAILGELLVQDDRAPEAMALLDRSTADLAVDQTVSGPFAISAAGGAAMATDAPDAAEAYLRRAVAAEEARGWAGHITRSRIRLAELAAARGRPDEALALADAELAAARALGVPGAEGLARRARGVVLGAEGLDELERAVDLLVASPLRLDLGWAHHALGTAQLDVGARIAAREHLRAALALADQTGGRRLARRAQEALDAAGVRARRPTDAPAAALTAAERRVADLAADGLGERAIAENLWLAPRTVEQHLASIREKLGIGSLDELGRVLARPA